MALKFYMDQNGPRAVAIGLRLREVDVVTACEDGKSLPRRQDEVRMAREPAARE